METRDFRHINESLAAVTRDFVINCRTTKEKP